MELFDDKIHRKGDVVDISNNGWIVVDNKLWDLGAAVRQLDASKNRLPEVPRGIGLLYMLTSLNLSFNQIERLPMELGKCLRLRKLDVSHNLLEELPPELSNCTHLEELDVSHNKIAELPVWLAQLKELKRLDATDNRLLRLPLEFGDAEALEDMSVMENDGLISVHPAARGNAKLIKWSCALEKRYKIEADELRLHNEALEELNRKYEIERTRLVEETMRVTRRLAEVEESTSYYRAVKARTHGFALVCEIM